jgi:homospermidine synthase
MSNPELRHTGTRPDQVLVAAPREAGSEVARRFGEILAPGRSFLGELVGVFSDWAPLMGRGRLYDEDLDRDEPWQFKNFRVT